MSLQNMGPKGVRKMRRLTGVEWEHCWNSSHGWEGRIINEDGKCLHGTIHRDGTVTWHHDRKWHMTSCTTLGYK